MGQISMVYKYLQNSIIKIYKCQLRYYAQKLFYSLYSMNNQLLEKLKKRQQAMNNSITVVQTNSSPTTGQVTPQKKPEKITSDQSQFQANKNKISQFFMNQSRKNQNNNSGGVNSNKSKEQIKGDQEKFKMAKQILQQTLGNNVSSKKNQLPPPPPPLPSHLHTSSFLNLPPPLPPPLPPLLTEGICLILPPPPPPPPSLPITQNKKLSIVPSISIQNVILSTFTQSKVQVNVNDHPLLSNSQFLGNNNKFSYLPPHTNSNSIIQNVKISRSQFNIKDKQNQVSNPLSMSSRRKESKILENSQNLPSNKSIFHNPVIPQPQIENNLPPLPPPTQIDNTNNSLSQTIISQDAQQDFNQQPSIFSSIGIQQESKTDLTISLKRSKTQKKISNRPPLMQKSMKKSKQSMNKNKVNFGSVQKKPLNNCKKDEEQATGRLSRSKLKKSCKSQRVIKIQSNIQKKEEERLSYQFFNKDIAGFIKMQFLKQVNIFDSKLKQKLKSKTKSGDFVFPSIKNRVRVCENEETFYADHKILNVADSFNFQNQVIYKKHYIARNEFIDKLDGYNWSTDFLRLGSVKKLVQLLPKDFKYQQLNFVGIISTFNYCDNLIKLMVKKQKYDVCQKIKNNKDTLYKMVQDYTREPDENENLPNKIEALIKAIKQIAL